MYHDVSSRLFRLIPKWSFSYFILQPGPGHLGRSPSATCRCPAWVASRVQLAPGLVAASDVLVFHLLQRKSGTLLAGILVLTCFFFHLLKPAHHASTFVVLQLFILLARFICSLFTDFTTFLHVSFAHMRHVLFTQWKLEHFRFFFGMFQDWWENLVDTLKFGGYEPWFPFGIPSKSTHHFPWGHGGEVLNARDVLLGLQEFGYPHIRGGTPCFTWRVNWRSGFEPI